MRGDGLERRGVTTRVPSFEIRGVEPNKCSPTFGRHFALGKRGILKMKREKMRRLIEINHRTITDQIPRRLSAQAISRQFAVRAKDLSPNVSSGQGHLGQAQANSRQATSIGEWGLRLDATIAGWGWNSATLRPCSPTEPQTHNPHRPVENLPKIYKLRSHIHTSRRRTSNKFLTTALAFITLPKRLEIAFES